MIYKSIILSMLLGLSYVAEAQQEITKRVALVIGIQSYVSVPPLQHSLNDAHDMATMLKSKDFDVVELYDPKTKKEIKEAVIKYFDLLQGMKGAAGLLYYSGHGMQVDGSNFLIPVSANPKIKADLEEECLSMDYILAALEQSGNSLNIIILDACRNNPFRGFSRSGELGLTVMNAPKGSYIVYATKPGSVASDGAGRNGLFTSKLLKYIPKPNLKLEEIFKKIVQEVSTESRDLQRPWISSDYAGDFYFTGGPLNNDAKTIEEPAIVGIGINQSDTKKEMPGIVVVENFKTVGIKNQVWMAENLNVNTFRNGDTIPEARTDKEWRKAIFDGQPAWCYYENKVENGIKYGKLYNWYAVNDARGLAPKGWHVPRNEEWSNLAEFLGGESLFNNKNVLHNYSNVGKKLKSRSEWGGNNESGFSALPAGGRYYNGGFGAIGFAGIWWTATEASHRDSAYGAQLQKDRDNFVIGASIKRDGLSVRCVQD